jgi:hypothetical protein
VGRHHDPTLLVDLTTQGSHADATRQGKRIAHPVGQEMALPAGNLDAGQDDQARGRRPKLNQLFFGPQPVMLGDDHAVEAQLLGPVHQAKRVH